MTTNRTDTGQSATTTAEDVLAAADVLRQILPGRFNNPPRLVRSTSERLDAIAFCDRHAAGSGDEWEHEADGRCCEIVDCYDPALAALIVALLRARLPLAELLGHYAETAVNFHIPVGETAADLVAAVNGAREVSGR